MALTPGKIKNILGGISSVSSALNTSIKDPESLPMQTKGLFGKKDDEQIAQLETQLGEQEKKSKQTMYIAIGIVAVLLLFGKKLMK